MMVPPYARTRAPQGATPAARPSRIRGVRLEVASLDSRFLAGP